MATKAHKPLFYSVRTYSEHGYYKTELYVFESTPDSLASLIEGCVDNKAGYGDAAAAARNHARFTRLLDAGYSHLADNCHLDRWIRMEWQHYAPRVPRDGVAQSYCRASVGIGHSLEYIERNLPLLRRILARAKRFGVHTYEVDKDPAYILRALVAMGATKCETVKSEQSSFIDHVFTVAS